MNLKKNLGRVATAFLATAMLASLTAVSVSANDSGIAPGGDGSAPAPVPSWIKSDGTLGEAGGDALTEMEFNKVLMLPTNVQVPDVDFTFTLKAAVAGEDEKITDPDQPTTVDNIEVRDGVKLTDDSSDTGVIDTVTAEFDSTSKTETATSDNLPNNINIANVSYAEDELSIDLSTLAGRFTDAGVYKYVLEEAELTAAERADYADFKQGSNHIVYLYVERYQKAVEGSDPVETEDAYKITGIAMVKAEDTDDDGIYTPKTVTDDYGNVTLVKSDGNIYNFYQLETPNDPDDPDDGTPDDPEGDPSDKPDDEENPDPDDEDDPKPAVNTTILSKKVDGAMGNRSTRFTFTVKLGTTVPGKQYTVQYMKRNADDTAWELDATRTGENFVLGDANTSDLGAEVTLAHDEAIRIIGISNNETVTVTETSYAADGYETPTIAGGTVDTNNKNKTVVTFDKTQTNDVAYTNTRDAVSPTGLAMNVAPYALLVVVAAGACFVFLRKRREDD